MRFFEDGPSIPDTLIEARDAGDVVLFCGAGISAAIGLPDFNGLADGILDRLTAQESREARQQGKDLDGVFMSMVKEFGSSAVEREITRALKTPRRPNLRYHTAALDLSRGPDGAAKVVTTNFDLIFERADRDLHYYVPPALPDLAQPQPIQGLIYLHGRLTQIVGRRAGYIVSSADFGRAYLSEGWAARFVSGLRERYTIVLLGYSANDPPMRYLLEGLNSREESTYRSLIYAFAPAGNSASDEAWRDKGVTTIPYEPLDETHRGLWDSLFAWAEAVRDPEGWRQRLVSLAQRQPADLRSFERGQVTSLVRSTAGATAFASAQPAPPAEWLCVFDANVRYAKPGRLSWHDKEEVDLLKIFGLDEDPPRLEPLPGRNIEAAGEDIIRWRRGDQVWPDRQRLATFHANWNSQLPRRLFQLTRWISEVMDRPQAIWWAAANPFLHPDLLHEVRRRLDRDGHLSLPAKTFWRCYLEARGMRSDDLRGFELSDRVRSQGWDLRAIRQLERFAAPSFEIHPATVFARLPPPGDWDTVSLRDVADIRVTVAPWPTGQLDVPTDKLSRIVALIRQSLQRTAELLAESMTLIWRTPTLHPTWERGESFETDRQASHLLAMKDSLVALIAYDPALARREVTEWDSNDPYFFAKLFLFASAQDAIVTPTVTAARILLMPMSLFWDNDLTREMLFALRAQWPRFRGPDKRRIERRIIAGPPAYNGETKLDHRRRRSAEAASWLRWLELQGLSLSPAARARMSQLIAVNVRWSDDWARRADESHGSRGGWIERVTNSQGLGELSLADIVIRAETLTTSDHAQLRDYHPFAGLVRSHPFRALAALRLSMRRGSYPRGLWRDLVNDWPETAPFKMTALVGFTLARLSDERFIESRHSIANWAEKFLAAPAQSQRSVTLAVFDEIVGRFLQTKPDALESGISFSSVGRVTQERSEVSVMKAINAPGGKFAGILLKMLGTRSRRGAMPSYVALRFERLLQLPGYGGGHAACVIASHLRWLDYWFPTWAKSFRQFFALNHPLSEAVWHGLAKDADRLSSDAERAIKPALLALLTGEAAWDVDDDVREKLVQRMTVLSFAPNGIQPVVAYADVRRVLMKVSDLERAASLGVLGRSVKDENMWRAFVRPFILEAWPRQLRFQSEASARQLASIAGNGGEWFAEIVETILPFLRSVGRLDAIAYGLKKEDENGQGYSARFPKATLQLLDALVGDDPQTVPWNLAELIETIAESAPSLRQSDAWHRLRALAN